MARTFLVTLYMLLGGLLVHHVFKSALETVGMPFAGVLPFENLFSGAFTQPNWEGGRNHLKFQDRIVAANHEKLQSAADWKRIVEESELSSRISTSIDRSGKVEELSLNIRRLTADDVYSIFAPLFATGVAFLLIGALVSLIQPMPPGVFAFLLYALLTGTYFLTSYDFHTTYHFRDVLLISFAFIPATVIDLSLTFPRPLMRRAWSQPIALSAYGLSSLLLIPYIRWFIDRPQSWNQIQYALFLYLSLAYIGWVAMVLYRIKFDSDSLVRKQCKLILFPLIPAFGTIFVITWMVMVFHREIPFNWIVPICLAFPVAIAIAMFSRNLFLVDRLEHEVSERTEELKKAQAELSEASKRAAIGMLAAGTAHEIGNAMNLISSNLPVLKKYSERLMQLVLSFPKDPQIAEEKKKVDFDFIQSDLPDLLSNVERGAERAIAIVGDLKSFSRPDTSGESDVDLSFVIESTLRLLRTELGTRIKIEKQIETIPTVRANSGQIHQVVLNVLLNAVQAISLEGTISISLARREHEAILTIQDSGKGISPEQLGRIFEPFFTTRPGGSGLGLSVSYGIVSAHGGKLSIASEVGKGTIVTMRLPFTRESVL